ncbi:exosome non-catalytic core subunit RRP40 TDEL_0A00320 [Torulaspora delbrueckii]|uniref:Ribosomal RNA-processing protein 40 n=1 Tax=Torulaspora delbrueckii TaxID=4950 RepID=G8ZL70_TORDE|nr:exosome complex component RRP40 [Torulaspora delbrueckii]CCE89364.1 hypothetical protein TDEL_0A00320 [Torulaspora delbrueckii]
MSTLIFPGDQLNIDSEQPTTLGPGLYFDPVTQEIGPTNAGVEVIANTKRGQTVYVDYDSKRYIPAVGDYVIGIIVGQFSDSYKVSLSSFSSSVTLSYMAFPNASKKNKPTLKVGDLVYARVCAAEKELEAEIECLDSTTGQDAGFGLLEGGIVIDVTLGFARHLLFDKDFPLLKILSSFTQFEVAIGVNGKIWVKCEEVKNTLACYRSIIDCQKTSVSEYKNTIKSHFKNIVDAAGGK